MINDLLRIIKNDVLERFGTKIYSEDFFYIHFGICGYIRDKYLWAFTNITKVFNEHFNTNHVDDISHKILEEIKKEEF